MLTVPNWLARVRILSAMPYPEASVDDGQFSVWYLAWERAVGENEPTVVPEYANRVV